MGSSGSFYGHLLTWNNATNSILIWAVNVWGMRSTRANAMLNSNYYVSAYDLCNINNFILIILNAPLHLLYIITFTLYCNPIFRQFSLILRAHRFDFLFAKFMAVPKQYRLLHLSNVLKIFTNRVTMNLQTVHF